MARDYEADAGHAATVEKVRASFESRKAIYIEKGAIRVRVSNIRSGDLGTILADIEEIPTAGFPIWIRGGATPTRTTFSATYLCSDKFAQSPPLK